jgi:tRNA/tmRNA/rRNA uracil-C5-methylase (TrmA/RlmC/RlmD family)
VPALEHARRRLATDPPRADGEWELLAGDDGRVCSGWVGAGGRGSKAATLRVGPDRDALRVSPGVFVQANALLRDVLADRVLAACATGGRVLELHAGAGFFTLGLARRFERGVAVESSASAVRDLRFNLRSAGIRNVRVVRDTVERAIRRAPRDATPDAVLLDPPRTGLARGGAAALTRLGAPRIVYLSCDPATLARDLAQITAAGYRLSSLEAFDLFPQTPHVEALAVLRCG